MRNELRKVLNLRQYFIIVEENKDIVRYSLQKPSKILLQNIHSNWLQTILSKTQKHLPVYLKEYENTSSKNKTPYGYICQRKMDIRENTYELNLNTTPEETSDLKFNLVVPEQDTMPYFIQWQRYRKFWWSSITTTPSLFGIDDIKHGENTADVNVVAKFPWGSEIVESLTMKSNMEKNTSELSCHIALEKALFILLLDGLSNSAKEGYLRLHRKIAPYKMSFAISEDSKNKDSLKELAILLHYRLSKIKISSWLPNFSLATDSQVKESLQIGVVYTIVLDDGTLTDGIFRMLNSSTMLKEQVHVADFESYAKLICGK